MKIINLKQLVVYSCFTWRQVAAENSKTTLLIDNLALGNVPEEICLVISVGFLHIIDDKHATSGCRDVINDPQCVEAWKPMGLQHLEQETLYISWRKLKNEQCNKFRWYERGAAQLYASLKLPAYHWIYGWNMDRYDLKTPNKFLAHCTSGNTTVWKTSKWTARLLGVDAAVGGIVLANWSWQARHVIMTKRSSWETINRTRARDMQIRVWRSTAWAAGKGLKRNISFEQVVKDNHVQIKKTNTGSTNANLLW